MANVALRVLDDSSLLIALASAAEAKLDCGGDDRANPEQPVTPTASGKSRTTVHTRVFTVACVVLHYGTGAILVEAILVERNRWQRRCGRKASFSYPRSL